MAGDSIQVRMVGVEKLAARLRRLKDGAPDAVWQVIGVTGLNIQKNAKGRISPSTDTGLTRDSILLRPDRPRLELAVGSDKVAAAVLEKGAGPAVGRPRFFPPPDALAGWAKRHGMAGAEWLIARSIFNRGLKPKPFLSPAAEQESPRYVDRMKRALREFFRRP